MFVWLGVFVWEEVVFVWRKRSVFNCIVRCYVSVQRGMSVCSVRRCAARNICRPGRRVSWVIHNSPVTSAFLLRLSEVSVGC